MSNSREKAIAKLSEYFCCIYTALHSRVLRIGHIPSVINNLVYMYYYCKYINYTSFHCNILSCISTPPRWCTRFFYYPSSTTQYKSIKNRLQWTQKNQGFCFGWIVKSKMYKYCDSYSIGFGRNCDFSLGYTIKKRCNQVQYAGIDGTVRLFGLKKFDIFRQLDVFDIEVNVELQRIYIKVDDGENITDLGVGPWALDSDNYVFAISFRSQGEAVRILSYKCIQR